MIRRFRNRRLNESIRRRMDEAVSYGRFEPSVLNAMQRDAEELKALCRHSEFDVRDGNVDDIEHTVKTFIKFGEAKDGDDSVYDSDETFASLLLYSVEQLRRRCQETLKLCARLKSKID